jgi:hypothetical protein
MEQSLDLTIVNQTVDQWSGALAASASWDSAAHDNPNLLRPTDTKNLVYIHLQADFRLGNSDTDVTVDKLVACKIHKRNFVFKDQKRGQSV